jgi:hypothetical protein
MRPANVGTAPLGTTAGVLVVSVEGAEGVILVGATVEGVAVKGAELTVAVEVVLGVDRM